MKNSLVIALLLLAAACSQPSKYPLTGHIEKLDPALDSIIDPDARAEVIATGYSWSEGPLWLDSVQTLLFSDVKENTIYQWTEANGVSVYLKPSGYTDTIPRGGEMGSNGLTLDNHRKLLLTQCGNRQIARMLAPLVHPAPDFQPLATGYAGKKFNSPNDIVCNSRGAIFFTDPPYGLEQKEKDPKKEMPYQGVFEIKPDGKVVLVTDSLSRPNGICFLPGEHTLIVTNSDPQKPIWYAFDVDNNDSVTNGRVLYNANVFDTTLQSHPDGLKKDHKGNLYAAASQGGLWFISAQGKLLGKYRVDGPVSNCSLSADEKTLYITNNNRVLRLKLRK